MRDKLLVLFIHGLAYVPLRVSRVFARLFVALACLFSIREYKVTRRNLDMVYPDIDQKQKRKMVKESLIHSAQMALETPSIWFRSDTWREKKTLSITDEHLLLDAKKEGRGVIILAPHFGSWELIGLRAASHMETTAMYAPPKISALEPVMSAGRFAGEMVPANVKGVLKVMKALKRGNMTYILPDQVPAEDAGIFVPFFGIPTYTMTLVQKLVQKTNPVVLIAYAVRRKNGFDLGYMEPEPEIYNESDEIAVAALNKSIENLIALAPMQYQWEYKRFKKQPDGSNPYEKKSK